VYFKYTILKGETQNIKYVSEWLSCHCSVHISAEGPPDSSTAVCTSLQQSRDPQSSQNWSLNVIAVMPLHNSFPAARPWSQSTWWCAHCEFASRAVVASYQTARCPNTRPQCQFYTAVNISAVGNSHSCKTVTLVSCPTFPRFATEIVSFWKVPRLDPFVLQVWVLSVPAVSSRSGMRARSGETK